MPRGGRFTLAELVTVALILGSVAAVIDAPGVKASASGCRTNIDTINSQIELYCANNGSYPADLPSISGDVNYFPDGAPTCPVSGAAYAAVLIDNRVDTTGHAH
ncbi:MAG: type II secretion system protein [Planctomycetota bacterium]|jgi:hypothetical protein